MEGLFNVPACFPACPPPPSARARMMVHRCALSVPTSIVLNTQWSHSSPKSLITRRVVVLIFSDFAWSLRRHFQDALAIFGGKFQITCLLPA